MAWGAAQGATVPDRPGSARVAVLADAVRRRLPGPPVHAMVNRGRGGGFFFRERAPAPAGGGGGGGGGHT
ncbi:hypothetical protein ACCD08_31850, partial [Telluria sp. Tellsp104]